MMFDEELQLGEFSFVAGDQSSFSDITAAAFEEGRLVSNSNARDFAYSQASDSRNDMIFEATGVKLPHPFREAHTYKPAGADSLNPAVTSANEQRMLERFGRVPGEAGLGNLRGHVDAIIQENEQRLAELRTQYPDAQLPSSTIEQDARALGLDAAERLSLEQQKSGSRVGSFAATFTGGFGAAFTDPVNVGAALIPLGSSKTILQAAGREAFANSSIEAAIQPNVMAWRRELGLAAGLKEAAGNVAIAGVFGGAFGGGGKALELQFSKAVDRLDDASAVKRFFRGEPSALLDVAQKIEAEGALPDEGRGALRALERDAEIDATRPDSVERSDHFDVIEQAQAFVDNPHDRVLYRPVREGRMLREEDAPDLVPDEAYDVLNAAYDMRAGDSLPDAQFAGRLSDGDITLARSLSQLSDEAFARIEDGAVPIEQGVLIGRGVQDASSHAELVRVLSDLKVSNLIDAEVVIRQHTAKPDSFEAQAVLSGAEMDVLADRRSLADVAQRVVSGKQLTEADKNLLREMDERRITSPSLEARTVADAPTRENMQAATAVEGEALSLEALPGFDETDALRTDNMLKRFSDCIPG